MQPDDDSPEEFQWLLYCYHCGRRLNQPDDLSTKEVEPQICAQCADVPPQSLTPT